jgi:hypothetical protein
MEHAFRFIYLHIILLPFTACVLEGNKIRRQAFQSALTESLYTRYFTFLFYVLFPLMKQRCLRPVTHKLLQQKDHALLKGFKYETVNFSQFKHIKINLCYYCRLQEIKEYDTDMVFNDVTEVHNSFRAKSWLTPTHARGYGVCVCVCVCGGRTERHDGPCVSISCTPCRRTI